MCKAFVQGLDWNCILAKHIQSWWQKRKKREWLYDYVYFPEFIFLLIIFQTFLCLFDIRKVGQRKTLFSQRKIWLGFQKSVFLKNLGGKHFPEVVKNLEISYYLMIIANLVLKLLIVIYILFWIFIFQFHLLKFKEP